MRQYQDQPLAYVTVDSWTAALMIEAETGFLVYGVVTRPDGRKEETSFPYIGTDAITGRVPTERSQEELIEACHDLLRAYRQSLPL